MSRYKASGKTLTKMLARKKLTYTIGGQIVNFREEIPTPKRSKLIEEFKKVFNKK